MGSATQRTELDGYVDASSSHRTSALTWNSAALEKAFGQSFSEDTMGRRMAAYRGSAGDTSRAYTYDAASRLTGYEGPFELVYFVHVANRVQAETWCIAL